MGQVFGAAVKKLLWTTVSHRRLHRLKSCTTSECSFLLMCTLEAWSDVKRHSGFGLVQPMLCLSVHLSAFKYMHNYFLKKKKK